MCAATRGRHQNDPTIQQLPSSSFPECSLPQRSSPLSATRSSTSSIPGAGSPFLPDTTGWIQRSWKLQRRSLRRWRHSKKIQEQLVIFAAHGGEGRRHVVAMWRLSPPQLGHQTRPLTTITHGGSLCMPGWRDSLLQAGPMERLLPGSSGHLGRAEDCVLSSFSSSEGCCLG